MRGLLYILIYIMCPSTDLQRSRHRHGFDRYLQYIGIRQDEELIPVNTPPNATHRWVLDPTDQYILVTFLAAPQAKTEYQYRFSMPRRPIGRELTGQRSPWGSWVFSLCEQFVRIWFSWQWTSRCSWISLDYWSPVAWTGWNRPGPNHEIFIRISC